MMETLVVDPTRRLTAAQALQHPFLTGQHPYQAPQGALPAILAPVPTPSVPLASRPDQGAQHNPDEVVDFSLLEKWLAEERALEAGVETQNLLQTEGQGQGQGEVDLEQHQQHPHTNTVGTQTDLDGPQLRLEGSELLEGGAPSIRTSRTPSMRDLDSNSMPAAPEIDSEPGSEAEPLGSQSGSPPTAPALLLLRVPVADLRRIGLGAPSVAPDGTEIDVPAPRDDSRPGPETGPAVSPRVEVILRVLPPESLLSGTLPQAPIAQAGTRRRSPSAPPLGLGSWGPEREAAAEGHHARGTNILARPAPSPGPANQPTEGHHLRGAKIPAESAPAANGPAPADQPLKVAAAEPPASLMGRIASIFGSGLSGVAKPPEATRINSATSAVTASAGGLLGRLGWGESKKPAADLPTVLQSGLPGSSHRLVSGTSSPPLCSSVFQGRSCGCRNRPFVNQVVLPQYISISSSIICLLCSHACLCLITVLYTEGL